jgi:hypothetical protein
MLCKINGRAGSSGGRRRNPEVCLPVGRVRRDFPNGVLFCSRLGAYPLPLPLNHPLAQPILRPLASVPPSIGGHPKAKLFALLASAAIRNPPNINLSPKIVPSSEPWSYIILWLHRACPMATRTTLPPPTCPWPRRLVCRRVICLRMAPMPCA